MQIAVASGKGGTGKTLVSTSLARIVARTQRTQYLDCDVEEPNGHLFLRPVLSHAEPVSVSVPVVDEDLCTRCGTCSEVCAYGAIASLSNRTVVFPELCHACGACWLLCPSGAITPADRPVGVLEEGEAAGIQFVHGRLRVGEAMAVALIRAVKDRARHDSTCIIDAPPGTSCPAVATVRGCDLVLLVAEPTPFGLNDLVLAVKMVEALSVRAAVVVNRADVGDARVERYCEEAGLPIWGRIPHDRRIAEVASRGEMPIDAVPDLRARLEPVAERIAELAGTAESLGAVSAHSRRQSETSRG